MVALCAEVLWYRTGTNLLGVLNVVLYMLLLAAWAAAAANTLRGPGTVSVSGSLRHTLTEEFERRGPGAGPVRDVGRAAADIRGNGPGVPDRGGSRDD